MCPQDAIKCVCPLEECGTRVSPGSLAYGKDCVCPRGGNRGRKCVCPRVGLGGTGFFDEVHVAVVATRIDVAVGYCLQNGAADFMDVGTVGKATVAYVLADVAKQARNLLSGYIPQLQLADAWCVDKIARLKSWVAFQRNQLGRRGRMPSLPVFFADRLDA